MVKASGLSFRRFSMIMKRISLYSASAAAESGASKPSCKTEYDCLFKIRPFWNECILSFQSMRRLGRVFIIDEAMSKFQVSFGLAIFLSFFKSSSSSPPSSAAAKPTYNYIFLQGRCKFRQVVMRKPDPVGLKIDCLCDVDGFLHNALLACDEPLKYETYVGKTTALCYDLVTSGSVPNGRNWLFENRLVSHK